MPPSCSSPPMKVLIITGVDLAVDGGMAQV